MARSLQSQELHFKDIKDHDNAVIIDKEPDTCPACSYGVEAISLGAYGKTDLDRGHYVQSLYRCPRLECQAIFIAYYTSVGWIRPTDYNEYVFLRNTYIRPFIKDENFDEEIERLSPRFVEIYTQANIAEDMGLIDICGAGYRKSLEFLIKDYLKLTKPGKSDEIEEHLLGYVVAHYVEEEKIKNLAGLAKDIGNDETHYLRIIEGLSLEDMKKLIKLTTHWIVTELLTDKYSAIYRQLMQQKK